MKAIYKVSDIVRLGLHSLAVHKVRSALTALGIIFGVCSVIVMLAINEGAAEEAQKTLRELGSDNIIIESIKPAADNKAGGRGWGVLNYGLTRTDVERLTTNIPDVRRWAVIHRTAKFVRVRGPEAQESPPPKGGNMEMANVIATEPVYAQVARIDMAAGRFISHLDVLAAQNTCVVTAALAKQLFGQEDDVVDRFISLGAVPFRIVGLLDRLPSTMAGEGGGSGYHVIIPLSTDQSRFGGYNILQSRGGMQAEKVEVSQIVLQMTDEKAVVAGATTARSILDRYHRGGQADYKVTVPRELLEQQARQRRLWNFMFLVIASVSLIVGGIGIMNIMLASVTERTREIGIRRALGAKRRDVVVQFLIEAVTLTLIGGLVGVIVGVLVPKAVEMALGFKTLITPATIALPLVMAVIVGLVSGLYPAFRAARLDPIIALRHE